MARVAQPQPHQITSELRLDVIGKRGTAMPDLSIVHVLNLARLHVVLCDQLGTGEDFVERGGRRRGKRIDRFAAHRERVPDLVGRKPRAQAAIVFEHRRGKNRMLAGKMLFLPVERKRLIEPRQQIAIVGEQAVVRLWKLMARLKPPDSAWRRQNKPTISGIVWLYALSL